MDVRTPSFRAGFAAPDRGSMAYPSLWRGCVGAWCPSLGVTGSVLRDWSAYRNHGTLTNMDPATDWVASRGKIALDFDGSDDYVQLPNLPTASQWAVAAWFVEPSVNLSYVVPVVFKFGSVNGNGIVCPVGGSGRYQAFYNNAHGVNGSYTAAVGELFHIVAQYDGTTPTLYANGRLQTGGTTDSAYGITISALGYGYGSYRWAGRIDDVRAYDRMLTQSEIATLALRRGIAYETRSTTVYSVPVGGGIVGTAAITEADDTLTSAATIALASVLAVTESDDTSTSTATIALAAVLAVTETDDTLTSAGTLTIVAVSAITEADDSLSSTATIAIVATATITEAGDTLTSEATIADDERNAVLAITEADDTVTSTATISLVAVVAITEADDAITSTAGLAIVAVSAVTEASDTLSSASTIGLADPIWTIDLSLTGRRTATCLAVTTARSTAFACQYNDGVPAIAAGYGFLVEADGDYLVDADGNYLIASV